MTPSTLGRDKASLLPRGNRNQSASASSRPTDRRKPAAPPAKRLDLVLFGTADDHEPDSGAERVRARCGGPAPSRRAAKCRSGRYRSVRARPRRPASLGSVAMVFASSSAVAWGRRKLPASSDGEWLRCPERAGTHARSGDDAGSAEPSPLPRRSAVPEPDE